MWTVRVLASVVVEMEAGLNAAGDAVAAAMFPTRELL